MTRSIVADDAKRALLEGLVDDASLFPPAARPMREAVRAHARHRESAYAWLESRFVLPASRIDEFLRQHDGGRTLAVSVILDAGETNALERLKAAPDVHVEALEVPPGFQLAELAAFVDVFAADHLSLWIEASSDFGALAATREVLPSHVTIGAKVRCGGASVDATPSIGALARFVLEAQAHDLPWKATAGLHHPLRGTYDGGVMHGFLNLFIAGIALHAGALDVSRLGEVLAEEDARAFVVDPAHVAWRDVAIDAAAVAAARTRCTSFGSCSFFEPVEGLRALGILS